MNDVKYLLEDLDKKRVNLYVKQNKNDVILYSSELDVFLKLRVKPDYHWSHFWVKPGAFLLSKIWDKFDLKTFREDFSSTIGKTLYFYRDSLFIKNKIKYVNVSYHHLEHELRHAWQKKKYCCFVLRYGVSKKFRLKMEIDANVYERRTRLTEANAEEFVQDIADSLTSGQYFSSIKREYVEDQIWKKVREIL